MENPSPVATPTQGQSGAPPCSPAASLCGRTQEVSGEEEAQTCSSTQADSAVRRPAFGEAGQAELDGHAMGEVKACAKPANAKQRMQAADAYLEGKRQEAANVHTTHV